MVELGNINGWNPPGRAGHHVAGRTGGANGREQRAPQ